MLKKKACLATAAAAAVGMLATSAVQAQTPVIDGTRDASYGAAFAVQTVNTGFGDNQSELNAGYARIEGGKLYVMVTGNLESNNNKLVFFFDTKAGGQNVMRNDNPDVSFNQLNDKYAGMTFDAAFEPDYILSFSRDRDGATLIGNIYTDFSELRTTGGGVGGYAGNVVVPATQIVTGTSSGGNNRGVPQFTVGYNDTNIAGVIGDGTGEAADQLAAQAVTTGFEVVIDLPQINATGDFKMMVGVNGSSHDYWSNQFLAGLPAPQFNLGGDGAGVFTGTVAGVNFNNFLNDQFSTFTYAAPALLEWDNAGSGNWTEAAKWTTDTVPNATDASARLGTLAGAAAHTITLDSDISLQSLTLDSAGGYTIAGANTLRVAGAAATTPISVVSGDHTISSRLAIGGTTRFNIAAGSTLSVTGELAAAESAVVKSGPGTLRVGNVRGSIISVEEGAVRMFADGTNAGTSRVASVNIAGGATPTATLDLANNGLVVDYPVVVPQTTPIADLTAQIIAGRAGGAWTGNGITSSAAAANSSTHAIGVAEAGDLMLAEFMGITVDTTAVAIRYTRLGDANLSGTTDIADFALLTSAFNAPGTTWYRGDFNYDGTTDIADFAQLTANFNQSAGDLPRGAAVPEPASLGLLGLAAAAVLRRRRA